MPRNTRTAWQQAVDGLNALLDAGIPIHIEPDGHIANPLGDEHIEWNRDTRRWNLVHDEKETVDCSTTRPAASGNRAPLTRSVSCYVPVCSLCGGSTDVDGFTPHLDTPDEAIDYITLAGGSDGWTLTDDGRLICDAVRDTAHEDAHAIAGKRMGPDAMALTWDDAMSTAPLL
ncbi:hypothetical protein [Streptomyces sp. x-19]|uniref:hypothetical protein n=1 Tax=Streptomyces sp. x-19 TaxID=2789280 RepID=UPI00397FC457